MPSAGPITRLLIDWRSGNDAALDQLLPLVYDELHRLAKRQMRQEVPGHLLQPTALVHEAYLRLVEQTQIGWQTRTHFYAVAAQVMRHILIDYARGRRRAKRGAGVPAMSLDDVAVLSDVKLDELIGVHVALERLSMVDARKSKVFELRYFGGMSIDEAADVLEVSPATIARDWRMAKAWLRRAIGEGDA